jgi:protein-tyrosine phosphatase
MAAQAYWIEGPWQGRLAVVPRPHGGEWLGDNISDWRAQGIDEVVSFLMPEELEELGLEREKELSETSGIRFVSFPIPDRGVPHSMAAADAMIKELKQSLVHGKTVGLHCRQSIGRSGMIAAALLVSFAEEPRNAFDQIASVRGGRVPDTKEQEQWVEQLNGRSPKGERLFERYLLLQGVSQYEYEVSKEGKQKKPDFRVMLDREYFFEVKDFQTKDSLHGGNFYDPHQKIREKINDARKKFREYDGSPCCLVLYNNNASLVDIESPSIMLGAMLGDLGWTLEIDPERGELDPNSIKVRFVGRGSMMQPHWTKPQNTRISALITLRQVAVGPRKMEVLIDKLKKDPHTKTAAQTLSRLFTTDIDFDKHERQLGVIVWENPHAKIPFPRSLFCGSYDLRYGQNTGDVIDRVFTGPELAELEELERATILETSQ